MHRALDLLALTCVFVPFSSPTWGALSAAMLQMNLPTTDCGEARLTAVPLKSAHIQSLTKDDVRLVFSLDVSSPDLDLQNLVDFRTAQDVAVFSDKTAYRLLARPHGRYAEAKAIRLCSTFKPINVSFSAAGEIRRYVNQFSDLVSAPIRDGKWSTVSLKTEDGSRPIMMLRGKIIQLGYASGIDGPLKTIDVIVQGSASRHIEWHRVIWAEE